MAGLWSLLLAVVIGLAALPLARRMPRLPAGEIANLGPPLGRRLRRLRVTVRGRPRLHLGRIYRLAERGEEALRRMP